MALLDPLLLAVVATISSAPFPAPSLTSAEANIAYAVGGICAPYVLEGATAESVLAPRRLISDDGLKTPTFERLGSRPVRVGFAGFVHVGVGVRPGRVCEVTASGGDPQKLRGAVLRVMEARPEGFSPSQSRYLPGRFA